MSMARKPLLGFWGLWNISFGFFGIQVGFALQAANVSRIFQTLGASIDALPILWIAGPVAGLLVQPVVGYFSDRTWGRLGRRRPYFLAGAILCSLALVAMPNAGSVWIAAGLLWILDAAINVSMEPFRAFVGDMLDERQRTRGYAFQTIFIGVGAVVMSCVPAVLTRVFGLSNVAPAGEIPLTVRYAFYGGSVVLLATVLWTVLASREYSPAELEAFGEKMDHEVPHSEAAPSIPQGVAWLGAGAVIVALVAIANLDNPLYILGFALAAFGAAQIANRLRRDPDRPLNHILSDLNAMPPAMRRLALVQFLSWFALFIMWIYATPVVTQFQFGATGVASRAYNDGADWVGVLFGFYNGIAALYAFVLPAIAARIGNIRLHAINLMAGAFGLASFALVRNPDLLLVPMVGIGMAWASILTIPYALLCGSLPQNKLGIYMGLFNIFIVVPELVVSTVMGSLGSHFYPAHQVTSFVIAGAFMAGAALATLRLEKGGSGAGLPALGVQQA